MPHIDFSLINYTAVLVAGLATFMLGGAWYSGLFGKLWIKTQGYTDQQVADMKANMSPPKFFGGMVLSYLLMALVMAVIFLQFNVHLWSTGAKVGLALWIIAACVNMTSHLVSNRTIGGFIIDATYQLIYFPMMGAIIGGWR